MGEIIEEKRGLNKVTYKIKASLIENLQLKSHMKNIHLFCPEEFSCYSKVIQRGNNGGAKYFFVPFTLKSRKKVKFSKLNYQKINLQDKTCYVIVASKEC